MSHLVSLWAFSAVLVASITWLVAGLIGSIPGSNPPRPVPAFVIGLLFGLIMLFLAFVLGDGGN